jgi:hypothetical protein
MEILCGLCRLERFAQLTRTVSDYDRFGRVQNVGCAQPRAASIRRTCWSHDHGASPAARARNRGAARAEGSSRRYLSASAMALVPPGVTRSASTRRRGARCTERRGGNYGQAGGEVFDQLRGRVVEGAIPLRQDHCHIHCRSVCRKLGVPNRSRNEQHGGHPNPRASSRPGLEQLVTLPHEPDVHRPPRSVRVDHRRSSFEADFTGVCAAMTDLPDSGERNGEPDVSPSRPGRELQDSSGCHDAAACSDFGRGACS